MERGGHSQKQGPRCPPRAARSMRRFWRNARERVWRAVQSPRDVSFRTQEAGNRSRKTCAQDVCIVEASARSVAPTGGVPEAICASPSIEAHVHECFAKDGWSRRDRSVVKGSLELEIQQTQLERVVRGHVLALLHSATVRLGIQYRRERLVNPIGFRECPCHLSHPHTRWFVHEGPHGVTQFLNVPTFDLETCDAIQHKFGWPTRIRNNDRQSGRLSLERRVTPCVRRTEKELDVRGRDCPRQFRT